MEIAVITTTVSILQLHILQLQYKILNNYHKLSFTTNKGLNMTNQKKGKGRPKGSGNGRLLAPKNLISRAIKERNINSLLWAFITLTHNEIREDGKPSTFSGSDLQHFVKLLHLREVERPMTNAANAEMATLQLQQWLDADTAK